MVHRYSKILVVWLLTALAGYEEGLGTLAYPVSNYRKPNERPATLPEIAFASKATQTDSGPSQPRNPKRQAPPSSRSTATFALHGSSTRQSTIALRLLENSPDYKSMSARDRAFARLLLSTAERRQGQINKIVTKLRHKQKTKKHASDLLCEAALRIGAAQILFLDTPSYAAIKETVEVLRMHNVVKVAEGQIKYVNAILRQIDREGDELLAGTSIIDNVEPSLAKEWMTSYGAESTQKIVEACMSQSPIFITLNYDGGSTEEERKLKREQIRQSFNALTLADEAELLEHGSIRVPELESSIVSQWPGYDQGEWWVQDPSASVPAVALYNAVVTQDGRKSHELHVVDLCSAPGGKTAQLCSLGFGKVTAVELSSRRTKPLRENLERLGMMERCEIVVSDGRDWEPKKGDCVDAVLLDAPCSATGVGSRRPDILQKSPDLQDLTKLQRDLAVHVIDNLLKPGGIMVYATCSLLKSESEDQMQWLLSREEGYSVETIPFQPGEIAGFDEAIDEHGWLRIIPGHLPGSLRYCDGFFVARLRRKNE